MQHAYVVESESEVGIKYVLTFLAKEFKMKVQANPDVVVLRYGLLAAEDAKKITEIAYQAPIASKHKAIVIAAGRAYHEAQNALLKIFEEPPKDTYLFLILPMLGSLLPTLRSRVAVLSAAHKADVENRTAEEFIRATPEKRSAIIKKLASGKDEDTRRENREESIQIINAVEKAVLTGRWQEDKNKITLLEDVATLRGYLYDRSAPLRMILEHISLMLPKHLK